MGKGYQKGGYQQRGYNQERQYGHGRGRWRDREDPRLRRDGSIERRYNAPPSATSINATAFILCLSLYVRSIIEPIKEELQNLECFVKFSKWLSWLFRHGKSLLHTSLSLTLSELFHFREFMQHTNSCLSYIARHDQDSFIFGQFDTREVRERLSDRAFVDNCEVKSALIVKPSHSDKWYEVPHGVEIHPFVSTAHRNEWITDLMLQQMYFSVLNLDTLHWRKNNERNWVHLMILGAI